MQVLSIAKSINQHCLCKTLDRSSLLEGLNSIPETRKLLEERPGLFSDTTIYISPDELQKMKEIVSAIESVIASPPFQHQVLAGKFPETSPMKTKGVFMGYDFHMTEEGPKLIEINTNAGGAYLNLLLAQAQIACCDETKPCVNLSKVGDKFFDIFLSEWKYLNPDRELKTIAIMDEKPEAQFLYPEFRLFREMFIRNGVEAFIVDPQNLSFKDQAVWFQDKKIDLIYNRLTDFYLEHGQLPLLKEAWLRKEIVLTPDPRHHALFADKHNLETFTDHTQLKKLHVGEDVMKTLLDGIPKTFRLTDHNRQQFWELRKNLFFKPASGYGSKATYRGDKITHKVWAEMCGTDYVAQELTPPALRLIETNGKQVELKNDIRVYTYDGKVLLLASRLYAGQTTNFRTEGGGFAPVFVI